jgi:hypothetical protein
MKIVTQVCHRSVATTRAQRVSPKRPTAFALISALLLFGAASGCQNKETPPPLPTAKPATTPSTLKLEAPKEEDAGGPKKTVKKGGGKSQGTLGACCAALRQNAAGAPPETAGHMQNAAAACDAANATGAGKAGFAGVLGGLLKGAGMPPACK